MAKNFIVIAGNIGSGKTTLTEMLAERFGWVAHYESVDGNPYLADFYSDMPRWALHQQVFFLSKRFETHWRIAKSEASSVQDRSIYEDAHIFARALRDMGHMEARDYDSYRGLYDTMVENLPAPDLVVYVRRSVDCLIQRIAERGRDFERSISRDYLELLNECYESWIKSYRFGKVLIVEAENLDLKWRRDDFDYVCESLQSSLTQPELFQVCERR